MNLVKTFSDVEFDEKPSLIDRDFWNNEIRRHKYHDPFIDGLKRTLRVFLVMNEHQQKEVIESKRFRQAYSRYKNFSQTAFVYDLTFEDINEGIKRAVKLHNLDNYKKQKGDGVIC